MWARYRSANLSSTHVSTPAKAPPRPIEAIRRDVAILLPQVNAASRATREEADARRAQACGDHDHMAKVARRSADRLDAAALSLQDDAEELRWLASLAP
jgi:hypothetical protein